MSTTADEIIEKMQRSQASIAIQRQMKKRGISQSKLAKALELSQTWVSQSLLDDTERTLKRLFINKSATFELFLKLLGWSHQEFVKNTSIDLPGISNEQSQLTPVTLTPSSDYIRVYFLPVSPKGGLDTLEIASNVLIPREPHWPGEPIGFVVASPDDATHITTVVITMLKNGEIPEKGYHALFEHQGDDGVARVQVARLSEVSGNTYFLTDFFGKSYISNKILGTELRVVKDPRRKS
jgi:transcriptional regulator with XRE-family HTH domain